MLQLAGRVIRCALIVGFSAGCQDGANPSSSGAVAIVTAAPALEVLDKEPQLITQVAQSTPKVTEPEPADEKVEPADPTNPKYALLIGCSKYDHLPASAQLRGPVNDVVMMKELLTERFKFSAGNITVLAEARGKDEDRPLRANIEREFKRLAEVAQPGSRVVVYFSGHGAQLPDNNPNDPDDPEPDGLDEILCPADLKPEVDQEQEDVVIANAILDDELRDWLRAIQKRGGAVWAIIDACHSGTAIRGTEVLRQIPMEMLASRKAIKKAATSARASRGVSGDASPFDFDDKVGGIVAIYAAQPHEPTIELPLPLDSDNREWRGLLTYNLVKVLTASTTPVTYTELVQRIHQEYVTSLGRLGPVPLVEGNDRNREVLGTTEWSERSRLALWAEKPGRFKLNAGRLHGLNPGTILAVFPPAGQESTAKPVGYVRVSKSGMSDATVEPTEFNDAAPVKKLPNGGRCEIVRRSYGDLRLRVGIDGAEIDAPWRGQLTARANQEGSVFEVVDDLSQAQWLVRPLDKTQVVLVPAEGWTRTPGDDKAPTFGPAPIDDKLDDWLSDRLSKIARAANLLKISGEMTGERQRGLFSSLFGKERTDLRVEMLDWDADENDGKPLEWARGGLQLKDGSIVALRVHNASPHAVDFTVLFVDSGYGIEPVFPSSKTVVDNRLAPGASFVVGPLAIDASSIGLEHLVVIALKSEGQPVDFTWLAQSSLEQVRAVGANRGGREGDNPLDELFHKALFGTGQTRGLKTASTGNVMVQAISWQSTPNTPKP